MEGRMMTTDCAEIVYAVVRAEVIMENKGRQSYNKKASPSQD
jgi:hypothetical protein